MKHATHHKLIQFSDHARLNIQSTLSSVYCNLTPTPTRIRIMSSLDRTHMHQAMLPNNFCWMEKKSISSSALVLWRNIHCWTYSSEWAYAYKQIAKYVKMQLIIINMTPLRHEAYFGISIFNDTHTTFTYSPYSVLKRKDHLKGIKRIPCIYSISTVPQVLWHNFFSKNMYPRRFLMRLLPLNFPLDWADANCLLVCIYRVRNEMKIIMDY